jgi:cation diffusion facilitator family transporter
MTGTAHGVHGPRRRRAGGARLEGAEVAAREATHPHPHPHPVGGRQRLRHRLTHLVLPHSHASADVVDAALESSRDGMRTLGRSVLVLGLTTAAQAVIVLLSGSVALLGDTIHNAADTLTALPLGLAFLLGRRAANRRYTYGYGRAEDLAGVLIVLTIAASSALTAQQAVRHLLTPHQVSHVWVVALGALVGFAGNEWVARMRVRTGRRIGSAALVADGLHARADGFTSLAVLLGAGGSAVGWAAADPIVGLLITAAILLVLARSARDVYHRLMDSVDPRLLTAAEATLREVPGVLLVGPVRMRWIGHNLRAEADIVVDQELTVAAAHAIAVRAEHALIHAVPRLTAATIHTDPQPGGPGQPDPHAGLAHHGRPLSAPAART